MPRNHKGARATSRCREFRALLDDYLDGALPTPKREAYEHHLATCPRCRKALDLAREVQSHLRRLGHTEVAPATRERLLAMFREARQSDNANTGSLEHRPDTLRTSTSLLSPAAREARSDNDALDPRELLADLQALPTTQWLQVAVSDRRFCSWGFCELVLDECWRSRYTDPAQGVLFADVGVALAAQLQTSEHSTTRVEDLRGRAWTLLGNARRVVSDLAQADVALVEAELHLARGTGNLIERGRFLEAKGELRKDQRRFSEAMADFDQAFAVHGQAGDRHLQGRSLVYKAGVLGNAGELKAAIELLRKSLELIDPVRDRHLLLAVNHNIVHFLNDLGEAQAALEMLDDVRQLHRQLGDPMNLLRLEWLEGKVQLSLNNLEAAESAFERVRRAFLDRKIPYDVAAVSLELATVYAEQGRTADMKRLAAEMLPIFQSLGIHREAIAAVLVFKRAAEMEAVTAGLIKELAAYFQRASKEPGLRFRAPG